MIKALFAFIFHARRYKVTHGSDSPTPDGFSPFLKIERKGVHSGAALTVSFGVRRLSFWQRKALPYLSIPFFAGSSGFVSKVYCVNEQQNKLMGVYEWESVKAADAYIRGFAGRFMRKNAYPHTISFSIEERTAQS